MNAAYSLFQAMKQENLGYVYKGNISESIIDVILELTEKNLDNVGENKKIKKRIYFIMVESLQNIWRHQSSNITTQIDTDSFFIIQKHGKKYFISTGNLIEKDKKTEIIKHIEHINSLESDDLKKYSKAVLENSQMSSKGGAGLGLIEIARRSKAKLNYHFENIDDNHAYFYLHTEVPLGIDEDKEGFLTNTDIQTIHKNIIDDNISFIFNGIFNQDSLLNLISVVDAQIDTTLSSKRRLFNIIIEMIQNIVKHACNFDDNVNSLGKPAIFYLKTNSANSISFISGNYIKNNEVESLKSHFEIINKANEKELNKIYNEKLMDFHSPSNLGAGLGIIDLKMKSKQKIFYNLQKINDICSFLTIEVVANLDT